MPSVEPATRFADEQRTRGEIPRREPVLEKGIETATRQPAQVKGSRAKSAHATDVSAKELANAIQRTFHDLAALIVEPGGHHDLIEFRSLRDSNRLSIQKGPAATGGGEELLSIGIENDADLDLAGLSIGN